MAYRFACIILVDPKEELVLPTPALERPLMSEAEMAQWNADLDSNARNSRTDRQTVITDAREVLYGQSSLSKIPALTDRRL